MIGYIYIDEAETWHYRHNAWPLEHKGRGGLVRYLYNSRRVRYAFSSMRVER